MNRSICQIEYAPARYASGDNPLVSQRASCFYINQIQVFGVTADGSCRTDYQRSIAGHCNEFTGTAPSWQILQYYRE